MDKRFLSTILGGVQVEVSGKDLDNLDIVPLGENKYHIISELKTYKIELLDACYETKEFSVKVNGKKVQLKLENDFDLKIKQLGFTSQESTWTYHFDRGFLHRGLWAITSPLQKGKPTWSSMVLIRLPNSVKYAST